MKTKSLLSIMLAASATAAMAAPQVPSYNELDLSSIVSSGLFRGNCGVADLNGDDILDIFVKGRDLNNGWATTLLYLTGDGSNFTAANVIPDDGYSWERIIVPIDYNSDGNVDLILGGSWGSKLLKNDGAGNFSMVDGFALDYEMDINDADCEKWYTGIFGIADFNLDGYPDIIAFNGNPREDQGGPVLYLNNGGDGTFTRKADDSGLSSQRGGTMAVGDINGDGKPDLVVNGWIDNDRIRAYYGNGDGTFTPAETAMFDDVNRGTEKGQIILVDIDADGDLDLFVTGTSCPQGWAYVADVYLNDGTGKFTYTNYDLPGVQASGADWCDLNADGNMDLVYAGENDGAKTHVAINQGDGTFAVKSDLIGGHRGGAVVFAADVNGNGMMDIMAHGYQDNGGHHFQIMNGLASRGMNTAPTAPTNLKAVEENGMVTFTWDAGSDAKTPTAALRYNVYVKTTDGRIITMVPANPASGVLRSVNSVDAALVGCKYALNIKAADVAEWGVQTIDGCKLGSAFAKSTEVTSGAEAVKAEKVAVKCNGGTITVNVDAQVRVIDFAGRVVANASVNTGEAINAELQAGVYVVEATTAQGKKIEKLIIK
ncbi:MAG: T9SS type A sorting domain-containing protein [Muribaculaceae bacterium]